MPKLIQAPGELSAASTRSEILALAHEHATRILEAPYNLPRVYVEMKRYELYFKTLLDALKTETGRRALAAEQDTLEFGTARMTCRRHATYNYSADPYWTELEQRMVSLRNERRDWEKYLRELDTEVQEFADESTGELHRAVRPSVAYTERVTVTVRSGGDERTNENGAPASVR